MEDDLAAAFNPQRQLSARLRLCGGDDRSLEIFRRRERAITQDHHIGHERDVAHLSGPNARAKLALSAALAFWALPLSRRIDLSQSRSTSVRRMPRKSTSARMVSPSRRSPNIP